MRINAIRRADINVSKRHYPRFRASYHRFRDIAKCLIENLDQGRGLQYSQLCHSIANINFYKNHRTHLHASSHRF